MDKVVCEGGYIRLDCVFLFVGEKLFFDEEGMWKDIFKVLVVIMDGINIDVFDFMLLDIVVVFLRCVGVRVFIVFIGNKEGWEELYLFI